MSMFLEFVMNYKSLSAAAVIYLLIFQGIPAYNGWYDVQAAGRVLTLAGFSENNVKENTGWFVGCNTPYATEFFAKAPNGMRSHGYVCTNMLGHGNVNH